MLVPLPPQPDDVPWPTDDWPTGKAEPGAVVDRLLDEVMGIDGLLTTTYAALVVHRGWIVGERYGGELEHWDRPNEPVGPDTPLLSWSMAKSMCHAAIGMLVGDGVLSIDERAPVTEWADPDDPRHPISLEHLLTMRDGLDFTEDYVDEGVSDVIEMLFGSGAADVAGFAAARPLAAAPDTRFNYSSGTTNIVSRILGEHVGDTGAFLRDRLFGPIGMRTAVPGFDDAGTWVASSYVHATARDMARFGLLYLRDGVWDGERLLPDGWVDHGRRRRSTDPENGNGYGAQWWVVPDDPHGSFWANGYEGQAILVCPGLDLIVVRLGKTPAARYPALQDWRARVIAAFSD